MSHPDYQQFVDPSRVPRLSKLDAKISFDSYPPPLERLVGVWRKLASQPFTGITSDGTVVPGLYAPGDNQAPVKAAVAAAKQWLDSLPPEQRPRVHLPLDCAERRHWHNTPLILREGQLELEGFTVAQRAGAMEIVRSSLSETGFARVVNVMENNELIGRLAEVESVMNRRAFTMTIYGEPSEQEPWGWQLFGHHLALNVLFIGGQMIMSPVFLGLEPDVPTEEGGKRMFEAHEDAALAFMRSLNADQKAQAVLYDSMLTADQPEGRYHPDDGRHLGGAFQDNRVIPYEGLRASDLSADQRAALFALAELFVGNLCSGPAGSVLAQMEQHLDATYFAWIGQVDDVNPFYFRIHSPVVLIEFDHHSGIFLTNPEPERLHVHSIVRTPNGGDYGMALLEAHAKSRQPAEAAPA